MSPLAEHLECYLAIRRGLGFQLGTAARILRTFVTFAGNQGADHITTSVFLKWKDTFGQASRQTWARRLGTVRLFAQWLNGVDPRNEVPPRGLIPAKARRPHPYIYGDQEIRQILDAATNLPSINGIRGLTYSTLFGLIAVTGLRVSEAIALDHGDVDLENAVLTVRHGKFGKARLVPVSESTASHLSAYAKERDRLLGRVPPSFFVSHRGTRATACGARYNFASICQHIGLRATQRLGKHGRGPRIHDLRHTLAARTMVNWYRLGLDPGQEMIKLTTYLGHVNPDHTYWYIEAVPELLELAAKRVSHSLEREDSR